MAFVLEAFKLVAGQGSLLRLGSTGRGRWLNVRPIVIEESKAQGVPWPLIGGIAWTESAFNPQAVGPAVPVRGGGSAHAHGLMQIMSFHFSTLVSEGIWRSTSDWSDPRMSIRAAVWDLKRKGLGSEDINTVLGRYGGFVTKSPAPYLNKVLPRATFLALDDLTRGFTGTEIVGRV